MTTEKKLNALGFKEFMVENTYVKNYSNKDFFIVINYNSKNELGFIKNVNSQYYKDIRSFTELLKWNDFYEKQSKRIARRNESRDGSETQNQFHQAH